MKNEQDRIDDLFKQKLGGYQAAPSPSVWRNIVHNFLKPHLGKFSLLNFQNMVIAVAIIGSAVTVYTLWPSGTGENTSYEPNYTEIALKQPDQSTTMPDKTTDSPDDMPLDESIASGIITGNDVYLELGADNTLSRHQENAPPLHYTDMAPGVESPLAVAPAEMLLAGNNDEPSAAESQHPFQPAQGSAYEGTAAPSFGLTPIRHVQANTVNPPVLEYKTATHGNPVPVKSDYRAPWHFSVGAYFLPEWNDYRNEAGSFQTSYTQEILATLHFSHFFLRPGIGISRMQDDGQYQINYNQFEMVGYFFGVSSFTGVSGNPDSAVFETYVQEVYDTVLRSEAYRTDNAFTYLHIPFHVGYRFLNRDRFSAYLLAGPTYHHLLNEKERQPVFTEDQAELLSMENQTPVRSRNTWQFLLGIGAQYRITNTFTFTVEPIYQQYIKSPYNDSGSSRLPYSLGFRAGLRIDF